MKSNFLRQPTKRGKNVSTSGRFSVGDNVGVSTYVFDNDITESEFTPATISSIQRTHHAEKFLYQLFYIDVNNKKSHLWVTESNIKKASECDFRSFSERSKYKIGDVVTVQHWWGECYENEVIEIIKYDRYLKRIYYKNGSHCFTEKDIKENKNHINNLNIKVGDFVKGITNNISGIVNEVFTFDKDDTVFLKINGFNGIIYRFVNFNKVKEPVIIVSDIDPYGEEDWSIDD